jgi:hypothetical protein
VIDDRAPWLHQKYVLQSEDAAQPFVPRWHSSSSADTTVAAREQQLAVTAVMTARHALRWLRRRLHCRRGVACDDGIMLVIVSLQSLAVCLCSAAFIMVVINSSRRGSAGLFVSRE